MKVTVNWEQRMTFEADTESGHKVKMDAGQPAGDNCAPRPTELLLCGVGACSSMDIVETMAERGQKLESLKVEVRGDRPAEYPMAFTDLHLHYIARGDIDPAIFKAALQESMNLYCAAALSLKAAKHVTYELNDIVYSLYE